MVKLWTHLCHLTHQMPLLDWWSHPNLLCIPMPASFHQSNSSCHQVQVADHHGCHKKNERNTHLGDPGERYIYIYTYYDVENFGEFCDFIVFSWILVFPKPFPEHEPGTWTTWPSGAAKFSELLTLSRPGENFRSRPPRPVCWKRGQCFRKDFPSSHDQILWNNVKHGHWDHRFKIQLWENL